MTDGGAHSMKHGPVESMYVVDTVISHRQNRRASLTAQVPKWVGR